MTSVDPTFFSLSTRRGSVALLIILSVAAPPAISHLRQFLTNATPTFAFNECELNPAVCRKLSGKSTCAMISKDWVSDKGAREKIN